MESYSGKVPFKATVETKAFNVQRCDFVNQCKQGFIEKVENPSTNTGTCYHYTPHHAALKESSTTPLIFFYICSCRASNQLSLDNSNS